MVARHNGDRSPSLRGPLSFLGLLIMAGCFGLATGLLEGFVFTVIRLVPGWITWRTLFVNVSSEILWVAPLINSVLFLVVAVVLGLIGWGLQRLAILPRLNLEKLVIVLFSSACFYAVLRVPDRISRRGCFFLALGLGVQFARWAFRWRPRAVVVFQRSLVFLLGICILAAIATTGWRRVQETIQVRRLPTAPRGAPNVLLIVLDTARADHFSSYGYDRKTTPSIDRLAREGVFFERAYANSSWTLPSHASLMTGRLVHEHQADTALPLLNQRFPTLAEFMRSRGFVTGGFSGNTWWVTRNVGLDRGFVHFEDYFSSLADMVARTVYGKEIAYRILPRFGHRDNLGRKRAEDVNQAFLSWLDSLQGRPFFAFLNYADVHTPYLSPVSYHMRFMNEHQRAVEKHDRFNPSAFAKPDGETLGLWIAGYDGALAYLDAEIGELLSELERRGILGNTLVILTSDHGEAFGDHGLFHHSYTLYRELIHVPLILVWPGRIPKDRRVSATASLRDIPATIGSLMAPQASTPFPGDSLAKYWSSPAGPGDQDLGESVLCEVGERRWLPQQVPISRGWLRALVHSHWHFILHENGETELYDLEKDWGEKTNLASTHPGREIVRGFKQQIERVTAIQSK